MSSDEKRDGAYEPPVLVCRAAAGISFRPALLFYCLQLFSLAAAVRQSQKLSLDATQTVAVAVAVRATSSQCSLPRTSVIIARIVELDEC
jgi:hypothetical protein